MFDKLIKVFVLMYFYVDSLGGVFVFDVGEIVVFDLI